MSLMRMRPSPNSLVVFESAARHRSFTAAARELRSTQSAVSQQIKALEEHLGVALFERIYRGVCLTEAGTLLMGGVEEGFASIERALDRVRQHRGHPRLTLMTDFSLAAYWLLPRLTRFRALHPDIDVQLLTNQGDIGWRDTEADVAIVFSADPVARDHPRLIEERVCPVCSPGFLAGFGDVGDLARLRQAPLLALSDERGQRWLDWSSLFHHFSDARLEPTPALTFDNYTLLIQAAIAGEGIALGWRGLVDEMVERGLLVTLDDFAVQTPHGYDLVDTHRARPSLVKQRFLDWILTQG
ncbi:LysR substrate-binding domain-containing protein [Halomonas sp. V046]|uniref:LysR substrate-binding domain-containing protein n=1 Tax=Halomonas sp. V046 TaxID=3459611 RepID=UPI0040442D08